MTQLTLDPIPGNGIAYRLGYHETDENPFANIGVGVHNQSRPCHSDT
jgi:hypothetical protein